MPQAKTLPQAKSRFQKSVDRLQKALDAEAQHLLEKEGRFHNQSGGFYGAIIGSKSITAKNTEELKAKIAACLLQALSP